MPYKYKSVYSKGKKFPLGPHRDEEACPNCGQADTNVAQGGKFRCVNCGYKAPKFPRGGLFGSGLHG